MYYVLKNKQPVSTDDVHEWSRFFESKDRIVKQTAVGNYFVSTVFLGIEHGFDDNGLPFLFEAMTFLEGDDVGIIRAIDWYGALNNHYLEIETRKGLCK